MARKAKTAPKGKRHPLNMRTTKELRDRIETAALASGRSLVQEVEFRLEQSFHTDSLIHLLHGSEASATALRLIAAAMQMETVGEDGTPWPQDASKREVVFRATCLIMAAVAGQPSPFPPIRRDDSSSENLPSERGQLLAQFLLARSGMKVSPEILPAELGAVLAQFRTPPDSN